jgi:hypothetical protein
VQTCSKCNALSPDTAMHCENCQADLRNYSTTAVALRRFNENPRVRDIRLVIQADACPVCASFEGTYTKGEVPELPIEGCSNANGCRCFYEPMLNEMYP